MGLYNKNKYQLWNVDTLELFSTDDTSKIGKEFGVYQCGETMRLIKIQPTHFFSGGIQRRWTRFRFSSVREVEYTLWALMRRLTGRRG